MNELAPVIIPSYEPNQNLLDLLSQLTKSDLSPIVLVNDGSSEQYSHFFEEARVNFGATVLTHEVNMGKGAALKTAFRYCLDNFPDMYGCVTADSDGQHSPKDIIATLKRLHEKGDCLVLGVRRFDSSDVPEKSRFGNNTTRKVFRLLLGKDISDTQTGLRAIPAELLKDFIRIPGNRFEYETRMLIYAVENHIDIEEVPIDTIYDSSRDHSTHFRAVIDSVRVFSSFGITFGKYLVSSLSSSVIDLILFQLFCNLFGKTFGGIKYVAIASILARIISATYNYLINFHIVFKSKQNHLKATIKYFLLAAAIMTCSTVFTSLLVMVTGVSTESFVKIPVDLILFFASYFIQKKKIF